MIKKFRQANQGRKILRDWVGESGTPVPLNEAQSRANVCLHGGPNGERCPYNYQGSWLWNLATSIAINQQMEIRENMKIKLEGDENLHVCDRCGCKLKLKVHTPFHHLYRHTSDHQFTQLPPWCWMVQELNKMKGRP